jgi:hypothetical protein
METGSVQYKSQVSKTNFFFFFSEITPKYQKGSSKARTLAGKKKQSKVIINLRCSEKRS